MMERCLSMLSSILLQLAQFQRIFPYDISIKLVLMRAVQLCHDVLTFSLIVTLPSLNLLLVTKESALDIYIQRVQFNCVEIFTMTSLTLTLSKHKYPPEAPSPPLEKNSGFALVLCILFRCIFKDTSRYIFKLHTKLHIDEGN